MVRFSWTDGLPIRSGAHRRVGHARVVRYAGLSLQCATSPKRR